MDFAKKTTAHEVRPITHYRLFSINYQTLKANPYSQTLLKWWYLFLNYPETILKL